MTFKEKFLGHLKTINHHKFLVAQGCFKVGLYKQGILHDLSKYSPTEFCAGVKYFQGNKSPNCAQRDELGYSPAWLHHLGRNKHHYEYWIDYSREVPGGMRPVRMPDRYIAEMIMDRIAACKVYNGEKYTDADPLAYYNKGTDQAPLHPVTRKILVYYLTMLKEHGEKETFRHIKEELVLHKHKPDRYFRN